MLVIYQHLSYFFMRISTMNNFCSEILFVDNLMDAKKAEFQTNLYHSEVFFFKMLLFEFLKIQSKMKIIKQCSQTLHQSTYRTKTSGI